MFDSIEKKVVFSVVAGCAVAGLLAIALRYAATKAPAAAVKPLQVAAEALS